MSFTGNEDHSISQKDAAELTKNYRRGAGKGAIMAGFFGKSTIQKIIDQESCVGIRIYYGQKADATPAMVIVGVNADENDLVEGKLAERELPCPPFCGEKNVLNS